ncbi:thymopoietin a [Pholidichthys leucotaenia]
MPEYLDDPSVLTKEQLKSELLAHSVELPSGHAPKDVYVQLYVENLTARNKKRAPAAAVDAFSSDDELPPAVVSSRSRSSSGRKATRKTEKIQLEELDVTALTDKGLRDELIKHGLVVGPIVASTRMLYERKLQKLLDDGPAHPPLPQLILTDIQVDHNGNSESVYSDKEDEAPVPVTEPEPVVERSVRSRGKTPVTTVTHIIQHNKVEKIAASEQTHSTVEEEKDVLTEVLPNDINSPSGYTITCRKPIRGAAGRPITSSDLWNDENGFLSAKTSKPSSPSYTRSHAVDSVSSPPPAHPPSSPHRPRSAAPPAPPAAHTTAAGQGVSLWKKLLLLAILAAFLFLVYLAMEEDSAQFGVEQTGAAADH